MGDVLVRVTGPLRVLLTPRARRTAVPGLIPVRYDPDATVGHVVESLGVPLTEVGQLRLDGREVSPGARAGPGSVVEVPPRPRPQPVPRPVRLLLDVHLGALARRLRFLGVDTAYDARAADDDLLARAEAEDRVLLTQDRGLLRRHVPVTAAYVYGARPGDQLADVLDRFAPPLAPWTRCPRCNGLLEPVAKAEVAARLMPGTRRTYDTFARCAGCGAVYWRGAHARRLDRIVADAEVARDAEAAQDAEAGQDAMNAEAAQGAVRRVTPAGPRAAGSDPGPHLGGERAQPGAGGPL